MQAIILAGGYGTRLYPLTLNAPKPMVPVGGRPMVDYLLEKIDTLGGFSEIFIVTNEKFAHVFDLWKHEKKRDDIIIVNDGTTSPENRLGSLWDIQFVIENHSLHEDTLILGGDNFFEDDLQNLLHVFKQQWDTIGLYDTHDLEATKQFNNLTLDRDNRILDFIEKPEHPTSTLCATLIYCFKNSTLKYIKSMIDVWKADRAGDLITYLCEKENIYGYTLQGKWFDIGSITQLEETEEWLKAKNSSTSLAEMGQE